jgi:indolepyruvate ferredoxin oxidoreductase alpha subunit
MIFIFQFNGLEAVAIGLLKSNISFGYGVFGFPATEIGDFLSSYFPDFSWNNNEKVSLELAIGVSAAGYRSAVIVKQAGVNILYDTLVNSVVHGIGGGIVIIAADDIGCQLSTVEQDSRKLAILAGIPVFDPNTSEEILDIIPRAFSLSEDCSLPVMVRISSRLKKKIIHLESIPTSERTKTEYRVNKQIAWGLSKISRNHYYDEITFPKLKVEIAKIKPEIINHSGIQKEFVGFITSGACDELILEYNIPQMHLRVVWPIQEEHILAFIKKFRNIIILEEPNSLIENYILELVSVNNCSTKIYGKRSNIFPKSGPISVDLIKQAVFNLNNSLEIKIQQAEIKQRGFKSPESYPPLTKVYQAITQFSKAEGFKVVVDAGSSMSLNHEPYDVSEWSYGLGSSVGVAAGMASAGEKVLSVVGDFGFLHTGIQALLESIHQKINFGVIIINDFQSRRTGGQAHSTTPNRIDRETINLNNLILGLGVKCFEVLDVNEDTNIDLIMDSLTQITMQKVVYVLLLNIT